MITRKTGSIGSNSPMNRILLNTDGTVKHLIQPRPFTRTYCYGDILEVPEDIIPKGTETEDVPDILKGLVFADELSEEELLDILCIYPKWTNIPVGSWVSTTLLFSYENKLYKVNQSHAKQAGWVPGQAAALYTSVMPDGVIGAWIQPTGAHDSYHVGDKVTYNGQTWICTAGDGSGNNSWAPGVYGWQVIT